MSMPQIFFIFGCGFAFLGTAAGAFGAHSLKAVLGTEMLVVFETGVRYQMYHAFGLIAVAWAVQQWSHGLIGWAGRFFVIGIVLFSGSLYLLSLSGTRWIGAFTPLGGLALLIGWLLLGWGAWRAKSSRQ
jgi:uncharacterized membrane protein YgdD (TMEM256/DUF423 family)